ncbi:hypothetical protein ES703_22270 [subsurface metagenome]
MGLKNWRPWRLSREMGAMEWMVEEGFPGWLFSGMWMRIPPEVIAEWEAQTEVEAETQDKPRRKRKAREPAAVA